MIFPLILQMMKISQSQRLFHQLRAVHPLENLLLRPLVMMRVEMVSKEMCDPVAHGDHEDFLFWRDMFGLGGRGLGEGVLMRYSSSFDSFLLCYHLVKNCTAVLELSVSFAQSTSYFCSISPCMGKRVSL